MQTNITIPYKFTPRQHQLELFQAMDGDGTPGSRIRKAILRWHRRAGKDNGCYCYMIKEAAQVVGMYFYVFPTKEMARRSLWENVNKGIKLRDYLPKEFIKRISNQDMTVELINGSIIKVLGYDKNPESIRGVPCAGAVFSEFAYMDFESYKSMVPSIKESDGWVIINSTPDGRNHFYDMWERVKDSPNWYCSMLQTLWPDKPNYSALVSPEDINQIQEEEGYTIEDMQREYGVSFESGIQGAYYQDQMSRAREQNRVTSYLYDDTLPVTTYWDIGVDDTDACWFTQKVGDAINWFDYWERSGNGTNGLAHMLKERGYDYSAHYLPHDAGHRKKAEEVITVAESLENSLNNYEVSGDVIVVPKTNNVQASIKEVRKRFSKYHFDENGCPEGIEHVEMYHKVWDRRRKVFLLKAAHDEHCHCADALRMEAEANANFEDDIYQDIVVNTDYDILGD